MKNTAITIAGVARNGIQLIREKSLREALLNVYDRPLCKEAALLAQSVFENMFSSEGTIEKRGCFLNGWQATHLSALFVSGLTIRMLREASQLRYQRQLEMFKAAAEIVEVIGEDTGVDDTPHFELYNEFASAVMRSDAWRMQMFRVPSCESFRKYVMETRTQGPVEEAILTTMASENWNTGEYTFAATGVIQWMVDKLGLPIDIAQRRSAYVTVHAGETELGHFLHAVQSWYHYCQAYGKKPDEDLAAHILENYILRAGEAFSGLKEAINA
jgi:hypothetical protein